MWIKNDDEKWSRKNIFEIPPCSHHFLLNGFTSKKGGVLIKSTNSVIKMTWLSHGGIFKNIFSRLLFTIHFRPEMLKFHPCSILTRDAMVGFVISCLLRVHTINSQSTVPPIFSSLAISRMVVKGVKGAHVNVRCKGRKLIIKKCSLFSCIF